MAVKPCSPEFCSVLLSFISIVKGCVFARLCRLVPRILVFYITMSLIFFICLNVDGICNRDAFIKSHVVKLQHY